MANVANSKHTGPSSKDAVSGGNKFPVKTKVGDAPRGAGTPMSNGSEEARRKIMGLRVKSEGFSTNVEGAFKGQKAPR